MRYKEINISRLSFLSQSHPFVLCHSCLQGYGWFEKHTLRLIFFNSLVVQSGLTCWRRQEGTRLLKCLSGLHTKAFDLNPWEDSSVIKDRMKNDLMLHLIFGSSGTIQEARRTYFLFNLHWLHIHYYFVHISSSRWFICLCVNCKYLIKRKKNECPIQNTEHWLQVKIVIFPGQQQREREESVSRERIEEVAKIEGFKHCDI